MAEKKKPESKVEPWQEQYCSADLSDMGKSNASLFGTTDYLSPREAVQRMYSNDPEVRK